ncbi:MAG: LysR family transcriptional regulator substrate-binding protein [Leifsonia sp.]|nr:LysR family transcriptional regulator substrate-binding protein [Leifsonia sp.]
MFTVAYVLGVTPGKWAGIWRERMPRHPLTLTQLSPAEAVAALLSGDADVALVRLPVDTERFSAIPLYVEKPVVVAPKDHVVEAVDSVELADLDDLLEGEWAEVVELVAANVGTAIMPQSVARALSRKDVVARPVLDAPETRVALVWPLDGTTPDIETFIGIVRGRTANSSR